MPFNYTGVDYTQARQEIEDYIRALPESSRWKDFVETATGTHILDLLAALSVYLRHSVGIARRETYVSTARLRSSLIAIANSLAYPVNRANALVLEIDVVPNETKAWTKEIPIGSIGGVPLVLLQDTSFNTGVGTTIKVAAGYWHSETIHTDSVPFQRFPISGNVDNFEYRLIDVTNGNTVIPVRRYVEELDPHSLVITTYPQGVYLLSGDGFFARKLDSEVLDFQYISPTAADTSSPPQLRLNGTIADVRLIRSYSSGDTVNKLAAVIPGYRSARGRAVTLEDHRYIIMSYKGSIVDGFARPKIGDCCAFEITYINEDADVEFAGGWTAYYTAKYQPLTTLEKDFLSAHLKYRALVGTRYSVVDPVMKNIPLHGDIYVDPASERDINDIKLEIEELIRSYRTSLGTPLYVGELTVMISNVKGVQRVYITSPQSDISNDWNEFAVVSPNLTYQYA